MTIAVDHPAAVCTDPVLTCSAWIHCAWVLAIRDAYDRGLLQGQYVAEIYGEVL